ncbi:MAG: class I mannose-6-phosphate isomerase, partial [Bacteroidota bacterium]|nr:class I mannose-6-phosphate isomerase [Bacteroidota bacterium]
MYSSNYDKFPSIPVEGSIWSGWKEILRHLRKNINDSNKEKFILLVECYQGVNDKELIKGFHSLDPYLFINTKEIFRPESEIASLTYPDVTDDRVFGYMTRLTLNDFVDKEKVVELQGEVNKVKGLVIIYGTASSLIIKDPDMIIYADMSRWELQLRQRKHKICNIGLDNKEESPACQYKRGFFVDWRVCDQNKKRIFGQVDYWLDTVQENAPKMIDAHTLKLGLEKAVKQPFRLVPFFDPGPWGGQWMKEVCNLEKDVPNFAWCFDCVPEENSLLFRISGQIFELPAVNLVFFKTRELLGEPVESRFGQEFPIRFDFLDTMGGGNLSLQVHPTTQYIRDNFGMTYTQDESYYILDAKEDATVFLGLRKGIDPESMIKVLNDAQLGKIDFDPDRYINRFPAKKHDHFLIPNGTIHCSGKNCMVLEISATPYIFTFKLWDWKRLGLDGKPRPINITRGSHVIQWQRDTDYCLNELVSKVENIGEGDGWLEERTGLHPDEFIETRRHLFSKPVEHITNQSFNVIILLEGRESIVESTDHI